MKIGQLSHEVLSVIVMGETTLQSLAHSLRRLFKDSYEARIELVSKSLLELANADCIRWDFYRSYGNSLPERAGRRTSSQLLEDLAESTCYLRSVNYDEARDEVTLSIWISEAGQEALKCAGDD